MENGYHARCMNRQRYCYEFPRPAVTVDVALFRRAGQAVEILLIRRGKDPFEGHYALPGGFIDEMEPLEDAARRELFEETGLRVDTIVQLRAYGDPGRDPRGHTVSIAHVAVTDSDQIPASGDDAAEARWFPIDQLPDLAFDHDRIAGDAITWLHSKQAHAEGEPCC